jgi:hypothetical protein
MVKHRFAYEGATERSIASLMKGLLIASLMKVLIASLIKVRLSIWVKYPGQAKPLVYRYVF